MKKIGLLMVTMLVITAMDTYAQDWPQWRGANRDGVSKETGLNLDWTAKKPPLAWTFKQAGAGYSAPTVVGSTLYCQGASDGKDFAFALNTQDGSLKWKQTLGDWFAEERGNGPRGAVTVVGDKLYLIRGGGHIHCLSASDGKMLWQKDFTKDFNGKQMSNWGYSESPLVDGNLVICTPGSTGGAMVALDKNTGATVWRSTAWTDEAGYSSVIIAEVGGIRQYIQHAAKGVAGVSAKDGKLLWKVDYVLTGRSPAAIIPTPVFQDNFVYVTNGYGCGCIGIRLSKAGDGIKAETVYANKNMINQHGGVVLIDGNIYGYTDNPGASWVCQNLQSGEIVWSKKGQEAGVGKGAVLAVSDRLLLLEEKTGAITVIAASSDGWKSFGKMEIPQRSTVESMDKMVWTHLVVANGKLYQRDHDLLFCYDLK
ncbi:MAG: PQQ-like beta-propeller repeat protein [Tannerella sp.]|jgi:outer membrane protein assembly factor BamB|nr:PQQ-like beta-propeller repeat protein [Tannerella sp.]